MDMSISRRLGLSLLAALCLVSVFAASASAAGKPFINSTSPGFQTLTKLVMNSTVNPDGAATTVSYEYKKHAESESSYKVISSQPIGSGTTPVTTKAQTAWGAIVPGTVYDIRLTASNSFGKEVYAEEYFAKWGVLGGSTPLSVGSEGTWTLAWSQVGNQYKIQCNENSSGTFGTAEGATDSFKVSTSGCAYYVNNVKQCALSAISYTLNNVFETSNPQYVTLCGAEVESVITLSGPMEVGMALNTWTVTKPVTLTGSAKFNGAAATVTMNSTWFATGSNAGKKFGVEVE